jgi:hypothetical protein
MNTEGVVKEDPAAEAITSTDGELVGAQPVGQAGVDFGVSAGLGGADPLAQELLRPAGDDSSPDLGSAGLGGAGLRLRATARQIRAGGVHDHAVGGSELVSPNQAERPLLEAMGHVGVADQQRPRGPEQDPLGLVVVVVRFELGAAAMRSAALVAMFVAAIVLIGEEDASSRRNQFRVLMFWLGGCIGLFRWILSRR